MEQDQGTELHSTTEFVEQAQSGYAECEQMLEQLQELSAVIGDDENVSSLLDEMETAVKEAKDIADDAETAIESDDIHSAADAAAKIDELKATLSDAMSQVDSMRQEAASVIAGDGSFVSTKPAATSTTNSVSGYGSKGGSSSVPASKSDAPLSMWAKRMVGGMGRDR
jgi:chaperonin cofactor prefoldin